MIPLKTRIPAPTPAKLDMPHNWLKACNWSGMSLSSAQLPFVNGTTGAAPSAAEITYIVSKGFNAVRLLIKQELLQGNNSDASGLNKPYTEFASSPWGLFVTAVNSLTSQGIYVIIARHQGIDAQFGQAFGADLSGAGGPNPASVLADFYRRMVQTFGATNPMIGYSIDNEPLLGGGSGGWWDIAQECINTLRKAGSGQCIFIPGISYSGASIWSSVPWNDPAPTGGVSNATKFLTLNDPCNNIIAELHCYFSTEDSGAVETNVASGTIGRTRLANVVSWANTNNVRFFIGEFGSKAGITNSNANIIDYVSYCKSNSTFLNAGKGCVGMAWWTFGAYAFWNGYAYTLATQGSNPPTGTDSAQMTLLATADFFSDPAIPPAFDPTDISGMLFRYDPANATTSSGATITETIPNTATSAIASTTLVARTDSGWDTKPFYQATGFGTGLPAVAANTGGTYGNALRVAAAFTAISQPMTWYQVVQRTGTATATVYFRCNNTMTSASIQPSAPTLFTYSAVAATADGTASLSGALANNTTAIVCSVYNTTSSAIYVNSTTASATGSVGTNTFTSLGVGNQQWSKQAIWKVGDMFGFSGVHTSGQIADMMNWLGAKYSVLISP